MSITHKKFKNGFDIITICGKLEVNNVHKLVKVFKDIINTHTCLKVAVDLSKTESLDSSAFGVLIINLKQIEKLNGAMYLVNPCGYVKEVLANSNLDNVFPILVNISNIATTS